MAVGPRGSGLAQKKQVDIGWLLKQRLVLPSHSHGLRALIEQAAAKKKLKLDVKLEADSFRVLTSLVEEGLGYTLLPPSSVRNEVASGRLETAAIAKPAPMRELTLASPIDHPGSTAITLITKLIREELSACREDGLWDIKLAEPMPGRCDWLRAKGSARHSHLATAAMPQLYRSVLAVADDYDGRVSSNLFAELRNSPLWCFSDLTQSPT